MENRTENGREDGIKEKWYDYASWSVPVIGPIGIGIYNSKSSR